MRGISVIRIWMIVFTTFTMVGFCFLETTLAQCFSDTAKHTCFEYTNLKAHLKTFFPYPWYAQDFFPASANPNTSNVDVRFTLIGDDPNFEYVCDADFCCDNAVGGRATGTCEYPIRTMEAYSQTAQNPGTAWNVIGQAVPACEDNEKFEWTGTARVEAVGANILPFYTYSPVEATSPARGDSSACEAHRRSWQDFQNTVDATWDADIQRIVIPYANFWHHDTFWFRGWQTIVTLDNQTGSTVDYTIENHLLAIDPQISTHGHSGNQCGLFNEGEIETTVQIPNGQSAQVDAFPFYVPDDVRTRHDTALFIRLNPLLGGTGAFAEVSPNASGQCDLCGTCQ